MRNFEPKDYETLTGWWKAYDFAAPPQALLPTTGYICNEIAAGFLYTTNSPVAWVEWVVGDPKADKADRSEALDKVIDHISAEAKKVGAVVIFTSSNNPHFMDRLKRLGFIIGDTNTAQLFRSL